MKITLQHYEEKASLEHERDDLDINEVMDMVERLLLAVGFQPGTIKDYWGENEEESKDNQEQGSL